ncbi:CTL-like protein 1 [Gryllus bimaculatus]|nr:CTL-like protein 1 [Gryllus bimaculatus]
MWHPLFYLKTGKPLQYDANFFGPRAKRSCTDIICFLLFFCFVVAWIVVGVIAFSQGDPVKIIAPTDSDGMRCGYDEEVIDKKYLFYFDITQCSLGSCNTPMVCVKKCPEELYIGAYYIHLNQPEQARDGAICRGNIPDLDNIGAALNNYDCAAWYLPTKSVARRCIYVDINKTFDNLLEEEFKNYTGTSLEQVRDAADETRAKLKKVGETIVSNMEKNWPLLLGGLVIAMVLCMIYIVIMRWFAWIIVWVSLLGVLALLGFCCYITWTKYRETSNDEESVDVPANKAVNISWLIFFIASCIVLGVVLLLIIFLRNRIRIATALITEASRAVGSIMSTLFFPLVPWILQMGVIAWTIAVWLYIFSSAMPVYRARGLAETGGCSCQFYSTGDRCEVQEFNEKCQSALEICPEVACAFKTYEGRSYSDYFHAINIIGFFWVLCFISAFSDMALAGTFSTWYWTFKKSDVPFLALTWSIGRTLRYHIGTLAFGSLILAICRLIRVTLEYIDAHLRKYDNGFVKCVMCCFKCFFWCLEKFIKFINRNAYIMCAIHGKNFCRSARKGFNLVMRNIIRVFVVDKVTDFLLLLGKLLITGGMVALAFYIFSNDVKVNEDDEYPEYTYYLLPVIIVGIGTYFVTCIFFSVYHMAVDTIFLCFLEDLERNDGSVEKPYYMSKNLLKILGKKNKKYKEQ